MVDVSAPAHRRSARDGLRPFADVMADLQVDGAYADWFGTLDGATGPLPVVDAPPPAPTSIRAVWTEPPTAPPAPAADPHGGRVAMRRPLVRAGVLAVLIALVGGGATALAMDKKVTVTVDGQDRILHTYAADVSGALVGAGLVPTPQDRIEPALPTDVVDGDHIIVNRARKLTLIEGGAQRAVWTTADSVEEALRGLGVEAAPSHLSAAPGAAIPLSGMSLQLTIPRAVALTDGTGAPEQVTTTASTVAGLLAERGIELGPDDVSEPKGDAALSDGATVQVVRNGVGEVVEVRPIAPPEKVVEDPELPRGRKVVVEKGKPGEQTAIMRVQVRNGREVRREQVRAGGSTAPTPRVVKLGTNDDIDADDVPTDDDAADGEGYGSADAAGSAADGATKAPKASGGAVWDKLAKCEATGNWEINTGNGYYGGLQFDAGTWRAYGGTEYSSLPHQASREQQIAVASKVRDDRGGYGAWPACSRKLGLPR